LIGGLASAAERRGPEKRKKEKQKTTQQQSLRHPINVGLPNNGNKSNSLTSTRRTFKKPRWKQLQNH